MSKRRNTGCSEATPWKPPSKIQKDVLKECSSNDNVKSQSQWQEKELAVLVQYIALYHDISKSEWPTHKNVVFWDKCATAIAKSTGLPKRAGNACRHKIFNFLRVKFKSVEEAEEYFNIRYFNDDVPLVSAEEESTVFEKQTFEKGDPNNGEVMDMLCKYYSCLSSMQKIQLISHLFNQFLKENFDVSTSSGFVPKDFLEISASALANLYQNEKYNILYYMGKSLEIQKDGGCRLPLNRMPFGLLSHNIMFFGSENVTNLHPEPHFVEWESTMYAHFGHKWAALQRGPMWSSTAYQNDEVDQELPKVETYESQRKPNSTSNDIVKQALAESVGSLEDQKENIEPNTYSIQQHSVSTLWSGLKSQDCLEEIIYNSEQTSKSMLDMHNICNTQARKHVQKDPMTARVNVAGLSVRQIQRRVQDKGFTKDTAIQMQSLKVAKEKIPNGRWWIKGDAFDIRQGLRESLKNEWSGDVDLADGKLQELKKSYDERLSFIKRIGLRHHSYLIADLEIVMKSLNEDLKILQAGHTKSKKLYDRKISETNVKEASLFSLAWDVVGYETLIKQNSMFTSQLSSLIGHLRDIHIKGNIAGKISLLTKQLIPYSKGVYGKQREAASHVFVFMIADEQRNQKPYAIPVRFFTYHSVTDKRIRLLKEELVEMMKKLSMVPVGFVTDGEFNSLRTMGPHRPISIIQLMMNARAEARAIGVNVIRRYLTPVQRAGAIVPEQFHNAVPLEDVQWLFDFMATNDNISFECAIRILRRKHFPFHYDPYPWIIGKTESTCDCLKSLMATYLFRWKISIHKATGVNFSNHLYLPEFDPDTGEYFHEREDHNHLLKRITNCLRAGEIPNVNLQHFSDALHDARSGLTKTALTGINKQSVPDCERIFSVGMLDYMHRNGHQKEMSFIQVLLNWHKASDGRGLSDATRHNYNKEMLCWLLDDWMPWHRYNPDYSSMDINRPIKGIQGLTRETIVGVIANIESQELRRTEYQQRHFPPEHPRASSTDDVEGFIGVLHDLLGPIFDHKTFLDEMPKICNEFYKRMDPNLPFFYWSSYKDRYQSEPLPHFNQSSAKGEERLDKVKISRRSDPGVFVANRAQLPQRNSLTVRAQFHRAPDMLPNISLSQN